MRGRAALVLVESLIVAVRPQLPSGVRDVRAALGVLDALLVWAVPESVTDVAGYGFLDVEPGGSGGFRGPAAPFGVGSWLPLAPRAWRLRQDVEDALGMVQSAVEDVAGPWPGPGATPRARVDGEAAAVWFEDSAGRRMSAPFRVRTG
jgi:hypothetical protein